MGGARMCYLPGEGGNAMHVATIVCPSAPVRVTVQWAWATLPPPPMMGYDPLQNSPYQLPH